MSHEGKMRRGEISKDPTNIDRIYFLEQMKPSVKEDPSMDMEITKKPKKVKNGSD
ncbi:hypothetical protein LCGC14_2561960 [marine sediment metagenome]|uniref:Uncharacterized protein n=1 Tax=marine sediment metagenome TaxID=412755 RepID=A0A0F9CW20_9ZZZZ